jgi:hypothetical protein
MKGNATENKKIRYSELAQDHDGDVIQGLICFVPTCSVEEEELVEIIGADPRS